MESLTPAIPYIISTVIFVVTQIIIYNKLKWDVEVLKQSVNGIGKKVNDIKEQVVARVYLYDSTKFGIVGTFGGTLGIFGSAVFGLGNATTNLNGEFLIPITDWTD